MMDYKDKMDIIRRLPVHLGILFYILGLSAVSVAGQNPRITEHPTDEYVAKNEPATLKCNAEGDPSPQIKWYRNGQPVMTSKEDPNSHRMLLPNGGLFFLTIIHSKSNKPDVGTYYCSATNIHGTVYSNNATLEIAVIRDDFRVNPKNTKVAVGDRAALECKAPRGQPEPRISWRRDTQDLVGDNHITIQPDGNLVLRDAQKDHSGTYICVATNIAGEKESTPAILSVQERPTFIRPPQDTLVKEMDDVEFRCRVSGDPRPTIIWKREDGQIPSGRARIQEDKSLKIERVRVSDEGVYICRAESEVGSVEAAGRLTVHSKPSFVMTPRDVEVGKGRTVSLQCEVTGNPIPTVYWHKRHSQVLMFPRQDYGRFYVDKDGTLRITQAREEDAGIYVCQALNVAGSAVANANVVVKDVDPRPPPIIHVGPQNQTLALKTEALLPCQASGEPTPTIKWFKNKVPIQSHNRITLLPSGTLQISDLHQSDSGLYTCKAISETGQTKWTASLKVEASTNTNIVFHRTPEPSTFPGRPSKPRVSDVTERSVKLAWTRNTNTGASKIFAYTVEYFSHETEEGWTIASDTIQGETYTVRHLRPDTAYLFLVRAQNTHGLSIPSPVSDSVRTKGGDANRPLSPHFDRNVVADKLKGDVVAMRGLEVLTSTAIKVSFTVLKSQRFIEGFHIRYRELPDELDHSRHLNHRHSDYYIETVTSSKSTMYVLRKLKKYTLYEVRVQPFYLTVEGQLSDARSARTYQDVPDGPPRNIDAHLDNNATLHVSWDPPDDSMINGILKGYKIIVVGNATKFDKNKTVDASSKSTTIQGLTIGIRYRVQIAAYTIGVGVRSDPIIIGGAESLTSQSLVRQPWFIVTLIGTIGGALWIALCIFGIWLYRKRKSRKKFKGGVISVPVHKAEDNRANKYLEDLKKPRTNGAPPDLTSRLPSYSNDPNMYNGSNSSTPQMKAFYNKDAVGPYATTMLVQNNMFNQQPPQSSPSAFRPIKPSYIVNNPDRSTSSDSCLKPEFSSDSNVDNRSNNEMMGQEAGDPLLGSPVSDSGSLTCDESGLPAIRRTKKGYRNVPQDMPKLEDLLPPPPEHPPPTDVDSPTESPMQTLNSRPPKDPGSHTGSYNPRGLPIRSPMTLSSKGSVSSLKTPFSDRLPTPPRSLMSDSDHYNSTNQRSSPRGQQAQQAGYPPINHRHLQNMPYDHSSMPRTYNDNDRYAGYPNPQRVSLSENERGPTPPARPYNIRGQGNDNMRPDSDRGPTPPTRMYISGAAPSNNFAQHNGDYPMMQHNYQNNGDYPQQVQHNGDYPHPQGIPHNGEYPQGIPHNGEYPQGIPHNGEYPMEQGPMMDHGMQCSYPSLPTNCVQSRNNGAHSPLSEMGHDYAECADSDMETMGGHRPLTPESSVGGDLADNGSVMASWASVTDQSDALVSEHSSSLSSSEGELFYTEADFASAVARAAELSGLTVDGSTVSAPPNPGQGRPKRRRRPRASSPYSTDSNFSAVPHKPYPKSERKKQLQEQAPGIKKPPPPVRAKPTQPACNQGYMKPSMPYPPVNFKPNPLNRTAKTPPSVGDRNISLSQDISDRI